MSSESVPSLTEWTHKLFVSTAIDSGQSYNQRIIAAENMALEALFEHGTDFRVLVWEDELRQSAPEVVKALQAGFQRVPDNERIWSPRLGVEYHCRLVNDDNIVALEPFTVPNKTDSALSWRLYDIKQLLILNGEACRYHSTPDEPHVRNCNLHGIDDIVQSIEARLESIDGACLFARTDAIAWHVGDKTYRLRLGAGDLELVVEEQGGATRSYGFGSLQAVEHAESRPVVQLVWRDGKRTVASKLTNSIRRRVGRQPPSELPFPDIETKTAFVETLERVVDRCEYEICLE